MSFLWNIGERKEESVADVLLRNRGILVDEVEAFLNPNWEHGTHDPFLFTQMRSAVDRLFQALERGEMIRIHGDYDADGISGSTLLYTALRDVCDQLDYDFSRVSVFLPDRERDGYGVAVHTIERFAEEGIRLIVTVDCGISNDVSLGRAKELGMDVIVCDHHQLGEKLPQDVLIIHPLVPGEVYPNKHLCGTGVAFKFASAFIREAAVRGARFPDGYEKWFLDLVAIATVTDVVPLKGENRVLEKFGLLVLNKTRRHGIRKIMDFARGEMGQIDTETIGFQLGPRINAAGRIASPMKAFEVLAATDEAAAMVGAAELEQLNRERQKISDLVFQQAAAIARQKNNGFVQVIWNEDWLHGVVGLVAGKIVSEFGVPAFVFTKVGEHYVGSGRSVGGLHLVEAMKSCGDIFIKAGGHPQACGVSIASLDLLKVFEERVSLFAREFFQNRQLQRTLTVECEVALGEINWDFYNLLTKFEPFGEGNRRPLFVVKKALVIAADAIGAEGKHLRLSVHSGVGDIMKMIGFRLGDWAGMLQKDTEVDIVFDVGVNEWNGKKELQCKIEDIRLSE